MTGSNHSHEPDDIDNLWRPPTIRPYVVNRTHPRLTCPGFCSGYRVSGSIHSLQQEGGGQRRRECLQGTLKGRMRPPAACCVGCETQGRPGSVRARFAMYERWGNRRRGTRRIGAEVAACGGKRARPARKAKLDLRVGRVKLAPPLRRARSAGRREPIDVLAVTATEPNPPPGKEPLHWVLLTTEGSVDAKTAKTVLAWYERRWTIEEYFRVLKSGTRVEDRRLDHADDLRKCLAFDAITACHVFDLERMARDKTGHPRRWVWSPTTKSSSSTSG